MRDIRIDDEGRQRCWNCGGMHFTHKRTARSKLFGAGAVVATGGLAAAAAPLATKKKLKCQSCGQYNDVGSAKPYTGPASSRAAKKAGTVHFDPPTGSGRARAGTRGDTTGMRQIDADGREWLPDPTGRHAYRARLNGVWTDRVSASPDGSSLYLDSEGARLARESDPPKTRS